jgi:3-oxoacyl-[acyl-carrier protein] reductase
MTAVLDEKVRGDIIDRIPMNRFGSPEDIANTAIFLALESTDYMTGHVLTIDGGMVM